MVGAQCPVVAGMPLQFALHTGILQTAGVDIAAVDGLYDVVGINIEHIGPIGECSAQQTLPPRQFITDEPLGAQVLVGGWIQVHLAHGGIAEALAHARLQLTGSHRPHHQSALRYPLAACHGVIVPAHACVKREPTGHILPHIGIYSPLVVLGLARLLIGGIQYLARSTACVPCVTVDALVVGTQCEAAASPQVGILEPAHACQCIP